MKLAPNAVIKKRARLRNGHAPRLMDIFAGCGGLSLGFVAAGFEPVAAVENDRIAAESHGANFSRMAPGVNHAAYQKPRDITSEEPSQIFHELGINGNVDEQIDVLVGGPPCQAFARVGRAKLRQEAHRRNDDEAESAHVNDKRVNLYMRYLHYVRIVKPLALLMENVPDMLNHGGRNLAEIVCAHLRDMGYIARYTLLNAAWYGVPQIRERMFLIAYHECLDAEVQFPVPTHFCELPGGYEGTRATARKLVPGVDDHSRLFEHNHRVIDDPKASEDLPSATTAKEALSDLPAIYALNLLQSGKLIRGRKDPLQPVGYVSPKATTPWSALMRCWPDFSTKSETTGHIIRYLPRDYKIFRIMKEGWQYPEIWRYVEEERQKLLESRWRNGDPIDARFAEVKKIIKQWTLPYDPTKFPNKWWKLYAEKPVRTLMAHLGKDGYSHIHFDSKQARTIHISGDFKFGIQTNRECCSTTDGLCACYEYPKITQLPATP
jgi:DNA (cytosine-5)-methyltransferase 1